ncbi:MAG: NAD-dependent epimerase/dehydratase family protein [Gaiellaceae bacterium]
MGVAIVTGSAGLVGSEAAARFIEDGFDVVGIDNDSRAEYFGAGASTRAQTARLSELFPSEFHPIDIDIRDREGVDSVFREYALEIELVIHAAAQPSHDWAASDPFVDFDVNAVGTLNLLEATRRRTADATFIFCSTNKVYGDRPNALPLIESPSRLDLAEDHEYYDGVPTTMPIDSSLHSLFGVSKASADLMVQEYGRYFGIPTVCFRGGCLTGPNHAGAELHGFLSYLMQCTVAGRPYTVFGYGAKQVRDNIHSRDLVDAFAAFHASPRVAAVYNIGGGRQSNCSMIEAIAICEEVSGRALQWSVDERPRIGDHRWWISDIGAFKRDYPAWDVTSGIEDILREIHAQNVEAWTAAA